MYVSSVVSHEQLGTAREAAAGLPALRPRRALAHAQEAQVPHSSVAAVEAVHRMFCVRAGEVGRCATARSRSARQSVRSRMLVLLGAAVVLGLVCWEEQGLCERALLVLQTRDGEVVQEPLSVGGREAVVGLHELASRARTERECAVGG